MDEVYGLDTTVATVDLNRLRQERRSRMVFSMLHSATIRLEVLKLDIWSALSSI